MSEAEQTQKFITRLTHVDSEIRERGTDRFPLAYFSSPDSDLRTGDGFKWLTGANVSGDRKPADQIREGRVAEVLGAIEQTETGSYA